MKSAKRDRAGIALEIHARAKIAFESGREERGMRRVLRALAILNAALGHDHPDVVKAQNSLGLMLQARSELNGAEVCFRDSVDIMERISEESAQVHLIRSESLMYLGNVLRETGRYRKAEPCLRRAVEELELHLPGNGAALAAAWNALAMYCKFTGRFREGIALCDRALAANITEYGQEHPETALIYHNIGEIHHARGAYPEAEEPARRSLEIRKAALGRDHPAVAAAEALYAAILHELLRFEESAELSEHALRVFRARYGEEHREIAGSLKNLGEVAAATGKPAMAEQLYRRALGMKDRLLGTNHPVTALTASKLAGLLERSGRVDEARPLAVRALRVLRTELDGDHPSVAAAGALVARLNGRGQFAESNCAP